jgi:hypothetical protein
MSASAPADDFLSGASGLVLGKRATTRAVLADAACALIAASRLEPWRLRRAARRLPRRRVLALAVEREDVPNLLPAARAELRRSRHEVRFAQGTVGDRGKFENLNRLLDAHPVDDADWLVMIDDDVELPRGFLDEFLFLAERFGLQLAQPAHRHRSHAAFPVTRRQPGRVARRTAFVEIGPVIAFHRCVFETLLPFPPLRAGWGLDAHWSALATAREWPIGVIDATPVGHGLRATASSYSRDAAVAEAREFLADRPYVTAREALTLEDYSGWR